MDTAMMSDIRDRLLEQKHRLLGRVRETGRDLRHQDGAANPDWSERGSEEFNMEVLEAMEDQDRAELQRIHAALERIDAGRYGLCARCGKPIDPRRLKALPLSTQCIRCAG